MNEDDQLPILRGVMALWLLREVVIAAPPGYVYEPPDYGDCVYVAGGHPSCLVGHVLVRWGWPVDVLARRHGCIIVEQSGDRPKPFRFSEITLVAQAILGHAQRVQNRCLPWTDALEAAEATAVVWGVRG